MNIKKCHEYTEEEFRNIRRNANQYVSTIVGLNDRIYLLKRKSLINILKEQRVWAQSKLDECEKHLNIIYEGMRV